MDHRINIVRIKAVHNALGELRDKVVFVGGATVSLYADPGSAQVRPTDDVDILIEVWGYANYGAIEDQLRQMGFQNDTESGVICRYKVQGIIVDVMPTEGKALGFNSKWHPEGFKNAIDFEIDKEHTVKILSTPYFLATKLEAFKDRGKNDGRTSQDFEDIVFVLENRRAVWAELEQTSGELKEYLIAEFRKWMKNPNFEEWIVGHVERGSPPATGFILEQLKKFII